MGMSNKDIISGYLLELLFLILISFTIGIIFSRIFLIKFNNIVYTKSIFSIIFFKNTIPDYIKTLLFIIVLLIISLVYPVIKLIKKSIIDIIKKHN